ncbi:MULTISPECIES: hypothetical protein [Pseudomonas aeruginosa group]|uniref:hypothetical protein n=1 Tax=Pseudomonas aeruginosa group TaxID=136841 RepID=UPI0005BCFD79|nr:MULTISPECIES: hypothetical protein [Pseudomonas aeruginosa group]MDK2347561.1 hypothetical protein [Pseudomonas paraeruginosa]MEA8482403.1 hypothetical protein [Pseudomonas aeruginosa]
MMKRILLDGELFAENSLSTLAEVATLADIDVSRLSFHPDDLFAEAIKKRQDAYRLESDPLRLEAEYDALKAGSEPDYRAWVAKIDEIKARYPLP